MSNSRRFARRVAGERHGPITRLISPSGLGEELKPFVFLDFFRLSSLHDSHTGKYGNGLGG